MEEFGVDVLPVDDLPLSGTAIAVASLFSSKDEHEHVSR